VTTLGGYTKQSFDTTANRVAFATAVAHTLIHLVTVAFWFADSGLLSGSIVINYLIQNVKVSAATSVKTNLEAQDQSSLISNLKTAGLTDTTSAATPAHTFGAPLEAAATIS
jgi:hypothetical protein